MNKPGIKSWHSPFFSKPWNISTKNRPCFVVEIFTMMHISGVCSHLLLSKSAIKITKLAPSVCLLSKEYTGQAYNLQTAGNWCRGMTLWCCKVMTSSERNYINRGRTMKCMALEVRWCWGFSLSFNYLFTKYNPLNINTAIYSMKSNRGCMIRLSLITWGHIDVK